MNGRGFVDLNKLWTWSRRKAQRLRWIGLLISGRVAIHTGTLLDTLRARLEEHVKYEPSKCDMIILQHMFVVQWVDGRQVRVSPVPRLKLNILCTLCGKRSRPPSKNTVTHRSFRDSILCRCSLWYCNTARARRRDQHPWRSCAVHKGDLREKKRLGLPERILQQVIWVEGDKIHTHRGLCSPFAAGCSGE